MLHTFWQEVGRQRKKSNLILVSLHCVLELLTWVKPLGTAVYLTEYWQHKFTKRCVFVCTNVCMCTVQFRLINEPWTRRKGRMWKMSYDEEEEEEWEDEEERAWSIRRSRVTHLTTGWFLCVWHCYEGVALVFDSPTTLLLSGNKMN